MKKGKRTESELNANQNKHRSRTAKIKNDELLPTVKLPRFIVPPSINLLPQLSSLQFSFSTYRPYPYANPMLFFPGINYLRTEGGGI